tara:strand:- start:89 stop:313 length:225 start_codon:yes stop_codon:yes gene_type:complete
MRMICFCLLFLGSSKEAFSHIGHFGQIADHGHMAAGIAIGLAGAIALIKILKGKERNSEESDDEEIQEEVQGVQ